MTRLPLAIQHYMTHALVVVGREETIAEATRRMRLHEVRHLPVTEHGKVVGLISQRDIHLIQSLCSAEPHETLVEEAMVHDVYLVEAEDDLRKVALHMAEHRMGSAVVAHRKRAMLKERIMKTYHGQTAGTTPRSKCVTVIAPPKHWSTSQPGAR